MKIIDIDNTPINACLQFVYRGCEISVSTILNKRVAEIAIFDDDTGEFLASGFNTIPDAIKWVDARYD